LASGDPGHPGNISGSDMTLRVLDSVRAETVYPFALLERELAGVGHRFPGEMARIFKQLEVDARFYPSVEAQPFGCMCREALLLRATYRLIFEIRDTEAVVALMHIHRRPGAWHSFLDESN